MAGSARRKVRAAWLIAVAALVLACDAGEGPREPVAPMPAAPAPEPVALDLVKRFAASDVHRAPGPENFCGPETNALLSAGWHAWEDGPGLRWTGPRNAVVEVPIVSPRDATLALALGPIVDLGDCPECKESKKPVKQAVRVLWNGRDLGSHVLSQDFEVDLAVPAKDQRAGPNRLELQPNWWLLPGFHPFPDDPRTLGIACRRIALRGDSEPPRDDGPGGFTSDGRIVQLPGSVVTFHLALPRAARLVARAAARGGTPGVAGRIAVSLLERGGSARSVGTAEIVADAGATASVIPIDADLAAPGERMASLSLAYTVGPGEGAAPALEWRELRIEGVAPPAPGRVEIPREKYNVFILLLDSLRADHVEPYGADDIQTPAMARLAQEGVTFLGARSNASWTRPAVASLLTSRSPSAHGVQEMEQRLPRKIPLLPAVLRKRGYQTVGVTANAVVSPSFGFARGFQQMHRHFVLVKGGVWTKKHATPEARAGFVWNHYLAKPLRRAARRPFFAYVHEIDPHSPYEPEAPYDALYDLPYPGNITLDLATIGRIRDDPTWADPMDIRHLNARYRGEVSFMDRYVGWILDRLDEEGLAERTLFVLVSDHGEEFMEHRAVGHAHTVYEELLRIPLILRLPGVLPAGLSLDAEAQLIDLAPTILDLIGEPIPGWMEGRSLLPSVAAPQRDLPARPAFASSNGPRHSTVRLGRWKLIRDEPEDLEIPRRHQLFDLESDPEETLDLWAHELVVGQSLRQLLEAKLAGDAAQRGGPTERVERHELDEEVIEGLRALGYME